MYINMYQDLRQENTTQFSLMEIKSRGKELLGHKMAKFQADEET